MNEKRAILYGRVSTHDQADQGYSLPSQLDLHRQYAKRLGCTVVAELVENYSGATPIQERPEGQKLVAMLQARQADVLVVYQVDRLSRDIVNLLAAVQMWIRAGIEVHTCDIGKTEGKLDIVGDQGVAGERRAEKDPGADDARQARQSRSGPGKVVVCGHAPYGYAYRRDERGKVLSFEIVEDEAYIVRLIYQWYVYGDGRGHLLSTSKIAACLSQMRVPTPGERRNGYHRKRGPGIWTPSEICSATEVCIVVW